VALYFFIFRIEFNILVRILKMHNILKFIITPIALLIIPVNNLLSQNFSVLVNGGYSYRLMALKDTVSESYNSYFNRKKPGINYNIEAVWYSENQGVGLRFNSFLNTVSGKNIFIAQFEKVDKAEKIRIDYYSIQYHYRKHIKKSRFWAEFSAGIGYVTYHSEGDELAEQITITGNTAGLNGTIFLDYRIFESLSLNISTNIFIAVLSKELNNGNTEILKNKEGLTRIDLNGGIRISF
jgi:hypothetical protein